MANEKEAGLIPQQKEAVGGLKYSLGKSPCAHDLDSDGFCALVNTN